MLPWFFPSDSKLEFLGYHILCGRTLDTVIPSLDAQQHFGRHLVMWCAMGMVHDARERQ